MKKLVAILGALSVLFCVTRDMPVATNEEINTSPTVQLSPDVVPLLNCTRGTGTGVVVSPRLIITASHVVAGGSHCSIRDKTSILPKDHDLAVYRNEPTLDFAIMEGSRFSHSRPVEINCSGFKTGETYYMIGYPYGTGPVTVPVVATDAYVNTAPADQSIEVPHMRELRGSSHPGMSGGPIIDKNGRLVGIVSSRLADHDSTTMARELGDTFLCVDK